MIISITSLKQRDKLTFVNTTDNRKLRCWNNKVAEFCLEPGASYEVETENTDYGVHITKAKRTANAPAAVAQRQNGCTSPPPGQPFRTPEQITVAEIVCAYITSGKCQNPGDLKRVMTDVCNAFRATWPETDHYSQAAE